MQEWTPFIGKLQCQREEANEQNHCAAVIVKRTADNQGSWPQLIGSLVSKVERSNAQ